MNLIQPAILSFRFKYVKIQVLTAASMKMTVFKVVALCNLVEVC
jgi:hypothetical protein